VLNDVPDDQHGGHQEEDGRNHRVDSLKLPHREVEKVENEKNNVDDDDDEVESTAEAETTLTEAGLAAIPVGAEQRADDESADDLEDLDDTSVGAQVAGVDVGHFRDLL